MNENTLIRDAAYRAARGEIPNFPTKPNLCLAAVRVMVENALYGGRRQFYADYLVDGSLDRPGFTAADRVKAVWADEPWANDMERSFTLLGLTVPVEERQAGDLIFNSDALPPYGHVGILIEQDLVIENIDATKRPSSVPTKVQNLMLTPYERRPWTTCVRLGEIVESDEEDGNGLLIVHDADNAVVLQLPILPEQDVVQRSQRVPRRHYIRIDGGK